MLAVNNSFGKNILKIRKRSGLLRDSYGIKFYRSRCIRLQGEQSFRMGIRSSLNSVNLVRSDIKKFLLMSRGFEGRGLEPEDVIHQ